MMTHTSSGRETAAGELFAEMAQWPIFDPHTHIDPHRPAARHFDEILGYHYYTELAHSAGMPADGRFAVARPGRPGGGRRRVSRSHRFYGPVFLAPRNCADVSRFLPRPDHPGKPRRASEARPTIARTARKWDSQVWKTSGLETVFLTNDFDDPLEGWDTTRYVPCLRTDDLVLKLHEPRTSARLKAALDMDVGDFTSLRQAIGRLFERFVAKGARAAAVSLPPDFIPRHASHRRAATPIRKAMHGMDLRPDEIEEVRSSVFWMLAEFCADFRLPFDLMIGPIRNVYPQGVAGGRDLFDRRVSLYDYRDLFNHFASVNFPVSTLSPDASAELVAYSWIFPNVLPMGHWWYSNVPAFIAARPASASASLAQDQVARILFRCVQARVYRAEVQHVPAHSG